MRSLQEQREARESTQRPSVGARPRVGTGPAKMCSRDDITDGNSAAMAVGGTTVTVTVAPEVDTEYDSIQVNSDIRGSLAFQYCGRTYFTGADVASFAPGSDNDAPFCVRARANQALNFVFTSYAPAAGGENVSVTLTGRRGDCE